MASISQQRPQSQSGRKHIFNDMTIFKKKPVRTSISIPFRSPVKSNRYMFKLQNTAKSRIIANLSVNDLKKILRDSNDNQGPSSKSFNVQQTEKQRDSNHRATKETERPSITNKTQRKYGTIYRPYTAKKNKSIADTDLAILRINFNILKTPSRWEYKGPKIHRKNVQKKSANLKQDSFSPWVVNSVQTRYADFSTFHEPPR